MQWCLYSAFATFLVSSIYVNRRGKWRYGFWRQLTNYSTFLAPYNALMYLFSGVPNRPVLERAAFPKLDVLRDNWRTIRDEALSLREAGSIRVAEKRDDVAFNSFFKRGWKRFYLKWYDDVLPTANALCPKTVALVESVPGINAALFALMSPGTRLPRHRDPFAGSIRYHLGLRTPNRDGCQILIDGEPYSWRDGEDIVWDETFLHLAMNETDEERIILLCDVERPLRTPVVRWINRFTTRHVVKISSSHNEDAERIGLLNRVSGPLYALRNRLRALKKSNRALYYAASYTAKSLFLLGVLYVVFGHLVFGA